MSTTRSRSPVVLLTLIAAVAHAIPAAAGRALGAMMQMTKIDLAALEATRRG